MEQRENFKSRLGFILVSAGCAIGIGNVWKFPFITGQSGGAVFLLFYLLFLVIMGVPVLSMELAVGRGSRKTIVPGYKALEKPGHKWHIHGWFCIAGCYLLMMYYTTVSGWMLNYFIKFLKGSFDGVETDDISGVFTEMLGNPTEMTIFTVLTIVIGFVIISTGLQKGLERVTTPMMMCLFLLIVVLAVHSVLIPGSSEGLKFYLLPSLDRAAEVGWRNVIVNAMNQSFFTLSLGVAAMEIFGSYMSDKKSLLSEAATIGVLDTFVALMSGLIIFPACAAYGIEPDAGPSLIFMTLPRVFINMPGGRIWGTLFFLFMSFASFSTVTAVFENLVDTSIDNFGTSRMKAVVLNCIFMIIASMPCVLGYNVLAGHTFIGARDVLDSEDFIVSNILLPGGSIIFTLFCTWKAGWGFDNYRNEANKGAGIKVAKWLKPYLAVVLPLMVLFILINGLLPQ